jgi:hypothetical protein
MKTLNSVLFEGKIQSFHKLVNTGTKKVLSFRIDNGETIIACEAWNELAEFTAAKIEEGARVRVVGRIKQQLWALNNPFELGIIVEHIDYIPQKKK